MIETYKILTGKVDQASTLKLKLAPNSGTRGNSLKIFNSQVHYDLRKYSFSNRIGSVWNNIPEEVIAAENVNIFKSRLDKFLSVQEVKHDWKADLNFYRK